MSDRRTGTDTMSVGTCVHCARIVNVSISGRRVTVVQHKACPGQGQPPRGYLPPH